MATLRSGSLSKCTLAFMLPSLLLKYVCYAASRDDLVASFRYLVLWVGEHMYSGLVVALLREVVVQVRLLSLVCCHVGSGGQPS